MTAPEPQARVLAVRMWMSLLATQELLASYLGVRLGLYDTLAGAGPMTPPQLASKAGIAPRYAREWLEQQAVAGILTVEAAEGAHADERAFTLPAEHAEVLTLSDSPYSMSSLAVLPLGGIAAALPTLLEAYRTGAGVPDSVFGDDWREGHGGANRALFTHQLPEWIATYAPDVHARLAVGGRIADVACGSGWSSIALAMAYPNVRVDGLDLDAGSIAEARRHAAGAGVTDRVTFEVRDAADPALAGTYDLVCLFDALHEISQPVPVLRACRALRAEAGTVLLMDAKVAASFTAPGDEIERFQYGTSVLHCLPAALVDPDSTGTGTVMRPDAVRAMATEAGFGAVTVLSVPDRFHRLYRLLG